eukprot:Phypoly_transcript_06577.p1 GENE.Phypoly_transcript_06577~~Phypoly_transcript_06577.p1  ORF type:complete len:466 (+),score=147.66 Phypoly_transcript_06577:360-1757(+)
MGRSKKAQEDLGETKREGNHVTKQKGESTPTKGDTKPMKKDLEVTAPTDLKATKEATKKPAIKEETKEATKKITIKEEPKATSKEAENKKVPATVSEFLKVYKAHFEKVVTDGKEKIRCTLNNADFPPKIEVLTAFVSGPKYKILSTRNFCDWSKYEPDVIAHKTNDTLLYCPITGKTLNKNVEQVEGHLKSKNFQKKKELWEEEQRFRAMKNEKATVSEGEEEEVWIPNLSDDEGDHPRKKKERKLPAVKVVSKVPEPDVPMDDVEDDDDSDDVSDEDGSEDDEADEIDSAEILDDESEEDESKEGGDGYVFAKDYGTPEGGEKETEDEEDSEESAEEESEEGDEEEGSEDESEDSDDKEKTNKRKRVEAQVPKPTQKDSNKGEGNVTKKLKSDHPQNKPQQQNTRQKNKPQQNKPQNQPKQIKPQENKPQSKPQQNKPQNKPQQQSQQQKQTALNTKGSRNKQ